MARRLDRLAAAQLLLSLTLVALPAASRAQIAGENVNMVSGTEWPGGDPFLQRQNEPSIAVSSVNPQHLLAGANDYRSVDVPDPVFGLTVGGDAWLGVFKSRNGGQTWTSALLPGYPQDCKAAQLAGKPAPSPLCGYPAAADPVMRAGTDGVFYFAGINYLRDKSASRVFVARFVDDNDKEGEDTIRHVGTTVVASAGPTSPTAKDVFIDKPWIAVDVPRGTGAKCDFKRVDGTAIDAGTIYLGWAQFKPDDVTSEVMISWSTDCGASWSPPQKLNTANSSRNQGVSIAIEPITGRVFVAWRRAAGVGNQTDAIMMTRSWGRQRHFSAPRVVANVVPFDQGNGWGRARTQTMPSLAISSDGTSSWAHVAWAQRTAATGDSRIFTSTAKVYPPPSTDQSIDDPEEYDKETVLAWSTPVIADPTDLRDDAGHVRTRGHQYMPSLTFGQGRLMLLYYDTRLDHTVRYYKPVDFKTRGKFYDEELGPIGDLADGKVDAVFAREIDDAVGLSKTRHTVDVRVASLPWGARAASGGALVSKFPFGVRGDEGKHDPVTWSMPSFEKPDGIPIVEYVSAQPTLAREQQLQLNVPGFPMFKNGTTAFLGDYIDLQGPTFVPRNGAWAFNLASTPAPVFHAVWTSNQDVKQPWDGDWTKYTPVDARIRPAGAPPLFDGGRTSGAATAVDACIPQYAGTRDQNIYTSRITEGLEVSSPQNVKLLSPVAVGFVVVARNTTAQPMTVSFGAPAVPGVETSWTNFDPALAPATVAATIPPFSAVHRTLFARLNNSVNSAATVGVTVTETGCGTACRSAAITFNPPIALTELYRPGGGSALEEPEEYGSTIVNPTLSNPTLSNPTLSNPTLSNPTLSNPTLSNPTLSNPTLSNPTLSNPTLSNPTLSNPTLSNPTLSNPTLSNPTLSNAAPTDLSYTVTNAGNTTTSYHVKVVADKTKLGTDPQKPLQLVLSTTYKTPAAVGCDLKEVPHDQIVANVPDVRNTTALVAPTDKIDPGASDSSPANATISLAPGESATITLRGYVPMLEMAQLAAVLGPAVVPAAVVPVQGITYENPPASVAVAWSATRTPTFAQLEFVANQQRFRAVVEGGGGPDPTGTLLFLANGTPVGTAQLTPVFNCDGPPCGSSDATFAYALPLNVPLVAMYLGDATYASSTSDPFVFQAPLFRVAVASDVAVPMLNQPVSLTATVTSDTPWLPGSTPTGNVAFSISGTTFATASLVSGAATAGPTTAVTGSVAPYRYIQATYVDDPNATKARGSVNVPVHYDFQGFLPPLITAGTTPAGTPPAWPTFAQSGSVPITWRLRDWNGQPQTGGVGVIWAEPRSTCALTGSAGLYLLYSTWHTPWGTPNFSADPEQFSWSLSGFLPQIGIGCHEIMLSLDDGSSWTTIVNVTP